jgi:hypothetical protein
MMLERIRICLVVLVLITTAFVMMPLDFDNEPDPLPPDDSIPLKPTRIDPKSNLNFNGEISLAEDAQVTFFGKKGGSGVLGGDQSGFTLTTGDINNDGLEELFIGAPNAPYDQSQVPPEIGPGEVYVYFGRDRVDFNASINITDEQPDIVLSCVQPSFDCEGYLGTSILVSDIDNDGYGDIIIGEPKYFENPAELKGLGRIYVIWGRDKASFQATYDLYTQNDVNFWYYRFEGAQVGSDLASTDIDNDGYKDIIIGAPGWDSIFIIWGGTKGSFSQDETWDLFIHCGDDASLDTGLGSALAAGDINNDGYGDILAGTYLDEGETGSTVRAGRSYVILGRPRNQFPKNVSVFFSNSFPFTPGITITGTTYFWDIENLTIYGQDPWDYFGSDVALGDINDDGYDDMFFSSPGAEGWNNLLNGTGEAYVFYGNDYISYGLGKVGNPQNTPKTHRIKEIKDLTIYGAGEEDMMGYSLYIGDVDQDGYDDMSFTAHDADGPGDTKPDCGEVYLLFGGESLGGEINISDKEVDLIVYGVNPQDRLGSRVTSGDLDNDGYVDLIVSANYADGPNNARKNCGETYILFGSAIRTKRFGLIDGYDPLTKQTTGGPMCFSGKKYYTFQLELSDSKGLTDIDQVDLTLDPEGDDIKLTFDQEAGTFSEVTDPLNLVDLDATGSSATSSGPDITLKYKVQFDWNYPDEDMHGAKILITNDTGVKVQARYYGIYQVENDLNFSGALKVTSSIAGDISINGSWCPTAGVVNWTGLRVVYEDTEDIYPPEDAFNIRLAGSTGVWFDNTSSGANFFITSPYPPSTSDPWGVRYDIEMVELLGSSEDLSRVWHYLRTDKTEPPAPTGLEVYPDGFDGPPGTLDNDDQVYVQWDDVVDVTKESGNRDGVGVKTYYVSTVDGGGTRSGDENWVSGGLLGYYYDTSNFYNLTFSKVEGSMDQDWGFWSPNEQLMSGENFSIRWVGRIYAPETNTYTFYIYADDGAKVWIDDELIYDEWKPSIPKQVIHLYQKGYHDIKIEYRDVKGYAKFLMEWSYGTASRQTVPAANLYHPDTRAEINDLAEGNNTIYVWAEDLMGNIGPASGVDVTIDTEGPYYIEPIMQQGKWYNTEEVAVGVTVADNISGASDDIQYSVSTQGTGNYGSWQQVAVGILQIHQSNDDWIKFSFDSDFGEGTDNFIRFRAKDQLGNGWSRSEDYNIKVDTKEVLFEVNFPMNNTILEEATVEFNVSLSDPGGSGIDTSSVEYRYSINGTAGYSDWTLLPSGFLLLYGQGRYSFINLTLDFPEGTNHWIQFRAKDVAGNGFAYSDQVRFIVEIPIINHPPVPVISHPLNNASFHRGDPILLDASNTTDDGLLRDLTYTWHSSWDRLIAFGEKVVCTKNLWIGNHFITVFVDDGEHNVSATISLVITDPIDPTVPVNPEDPDPSNDTDGDGMLDSWEIDMFGNINVSDGSYDTDGDGYSDYQEYLYDTDPENENDQPPGAVDPEYESEEPEKDSSLGVWIIVILAILLIIVLVGIFYFMANKQSKKDKVSGDNVMGVRERTRDDYDEDRRRSDDDDYYPEIRKGDLKKQAAERRRLYEERRARERGEEIDDEETSGPAEEEDTDSTLEGIETQPALSSSPEDELLLEGIAEDEFGESDMDMDSFDDEMEDLPELEDMGEEDSLDDDWDPLEDDEDEDWD